MYRQLILSTIYEYFYELLSTINEYLKHFPLSYLVYFHMTIHAPETLPRWELLSNSIIIHIMITYMAVSEIQHFITFLQIYMQNV